MRYERLILEAGDNAVTVRFHPRLTVIAGVGRAERVGLVGELLGSLSGGRGGAHLEVVDDDGRRLAVIRPAAGDDRVVESETGRDVTEEFVGPDGSVDVLGALGVTIDAARRKSRLSATDVAAVSRSEALVSGLAAVDQVRLWRAAERVRETDTRLKAEAHSIGVSPEDAHVIEEIERRHHDFEDAQRRHDEVRHNAIFIGGANALGAIPATAMNRLYGLPFLVVAAVATMASVVFRRRMATASRLEQEALAAAGARSYIGFHLQRVNGLLDGAGARQRLAAAAHDHREALEEWTALAGEVPVEWALTMRERILSAARRMRDYDRADSGMDGPSLRDVDPTDLAHAFVARLADLRHACASGESLPLILDEPLVDVDASVKQWMLELVGRSAGAPQVVYLTADEDVAAWARMEAIAGHLAVIEPSPDPEAAVQ